LIKIFAVFVVLPIDFKNCSTLIELNFWRLSDITKINHYQPECAVSDWHAELSVER